MSSHPANPKIYHITHIDNLAGIIDQHCLWSDAEARVNNISHYQIGMSEIKRRRLEENKVSCCNDRFVGEFVPFYFCPRSIMLYLLHMGNHVDIQYKDGQKNIIHLQADFHSSVIHLNKKNIPWAYTNGNAGKRVTQFYNDIAMLSYLDWQAIGSNNFSENQVKHRKQAEFLALETFPWELIDTIGVFDETTKQKVENIVGKTYAKLVFVKKDWYF